MTAAIRPRRRFAKRKFARPRRPRVHKDAWAFVPTGGALESRLRRLLSRSAEDIVHEYLDERLKLHKDDLRDRELKKHEEEEGDEQDQGLAIDRVEVVGLAKAIHENPAEQEEKAGYVGDDGDEHRELGGEQTEEVDIGGTRCDSQELPLVTSQTSEGLEILLLASQESFGYDDVDVPPNCARNDRAARRLWQQLEEAYEGPATVLSEGM